MPSHTSDPPRTCTTRHSSGNNCNTMVAAMAIWRITKPSAVPAAREMWRPGGPGYPLTFHQMAMAMARSA